ncbi:MAG TPA: tRNA (adenosine(37)-N6)-threonylcarbamoyltransferase complex ATPase subunit type 1 TsaE [Gammaproteobacteria bacterium]|jgi:tRNA threonylcarbamoyladenosine biosynthesis protein TsaE|nr:tRNA (adenosine(37)-N6)-threonylcarbamoyltransferase complex ATPase subunit type 1 TsaE [Gammaproteobacteria bacterium]
MTRIYAADVAAMEALGAALADALKQTGAVVYLRGELGAGKTTLVRGVARGMGILGRVRSPTYTLVEGYDLPDGMLYHLDLYRLSGTGELEFLGIRELAAPGNRVFIEWPERVAEGALPAADLILGLETTGEGRTVILEPRTGLGQKLAADWQSGWAGNPHSMTEP